MFFETERIKTRYLELSDLPELLMLQQDYEVMKYITGVPMSEAEIIENLNRDINQYSAKDPWISVMAIVSKSTSDFIGTIALYLDEDKKWEVGYRLLPKYWGMGYATEVLVGLINYVAESKTLEAIYGTAIRENIASLKVMEASGMNFVREYFLEEENAFLREYSFSFPLL